MTDHLKPNTHAWNARQRRHKHNSFQGHCRMASINMQTIANSDTATKEAKNLAYAIYVSMDVLAVLLKTRVDS